MNPLTILTGDCLETLRQIPAGSVHCCITSPPYWGLRSYGIPPSAWPEITFTPVAGLPPLTIPAQSCVLGEESEPWAYVGHLVHVFRLVRRALREDGTLWLNLGDCYATGAGKVGECPGGGEQGERWKGNRGDRPGSPKHAAGAMGPMTQPNRLPQLGLKPKDLVGIPERAAFALQADGWYWRSKSPWIKRNPMPESTTDRPSSAVEHLMLFSKSQRYYYDAEAVKVAATTAGQSIKMADGWDTGEGGHSAFHRDGRQKGESTGAVQASTRSRRNRDAFFASWQGLLDEGDGPLAFIVNPKGYEGAHFATFPPKLVEPCIRAGTSARGCCPKCGEPWERVVEKTDEPAASHKGSGFDRGKTGARDGGDRTQAGPRFTDKTTGWQRGCECSSRVDTSGAGLASPQFYEAVPCRVLDPFGGSGTTGKVALELARHAILCELNPQYTRLIEQRTEVTPGLALA